MHLPRVPPGYVFVLMGVAFGAALLAKGMGWG